MIHLKYIMVVLGMAISVQACDATQTPDYVVQHSDGDIEIRDYPQMVLVTTADIPRDNKFGEQRRDAFMRLFGYIDGGNVAREEIAMTTPVFMRSDTADASAPAGEKIAMTTPVFMSPSRDNDQWTMSFYLPARFDASSAPVPTDETVRVNTSTPMTVAAIRYSGFSDAEKEQTHLKKLQMWMSKNGYTQTAPHWLGFYNPPWTPGPLRRNEVLIPIE